jgi:Ala-tRNA(Pro) deacylase
VYTAQEIAAAQHVPGRQLAKCVLVKTDRGLVLAVLPAIHLIDFKRLKAVLRAKRASIAKESDIKAQFPDVEVGAMSPFGQLYNVPVVVDRELGVSADMVFNAGTHTETVKMQYQDFVALAHPKTGAFGQPMGAPPRRAKAANATKKAGRSKKAARRPAAKKKAPRSKRR